ncbi:transcriptional regulator [Pseudomonas luteola]|uniref:histone-like nucleoid-structuring protein, MvaT/MvaU family n=1 Tax=Pseudomonas luteola TaxID=47886 RepID=UPI000F9AE16D|nr:transcriptional regulator [Pseudomonas luteola]
MPNTTNNCMMRDLEFERKLIGLMKEYKKSLEELIDIINPNYFYDTCSFVSPLERVARRRRVSKIYKNPETGFIIKALSSNHKTLLLWKAKYGEEIVETWRSDSQP